MVLVCGVIADSNDYGCGKGGDGDDGDDGDWGGGGGGVMMHDGNTGIDDQYPIFCFKPPIMTNIFKE